MKLQQKNTLLAITEIFSLVRYIRSIKPSNNQKQQDNGSQPSVVDSALLKNATSDNLSESGYYELLKLTNNTSAILKYLQCPYTTSDKKVEYVPSSAADDVEFTYANTYDCIYYEKAGYDLFIDLFNENRATGILVQNINVTSTNNYNFKILFDEFFTPLNCMLNEMIKFEEHIDKVTSEAAENSNQKEKPSIKKANSNKPVHVCSHCDLNIKETAGSNPNLPITTIIDSTVDTTKNNSGIYYKKRNGTLQLYIHKIAILLSALIHFTLFEDKIDLLFDSTVFINLLKDPNFIEADTKESDILEFIKTFKAVPGLELKSAEDVCEYVKQQYSNSGYNELKNDVQQIIFKAKTQINDSVWLITNTCIMNSSGIFNTPVNFYKKVDSFFDTLHPEFISISKLPSFIENDILPLFFSDPSKITRKKVSLLCQIIIRIKFFIAVFAHSSDVGKFYNVCQLLKLLITDFYKVYCVRISKNTEESDNFTTLRLPIQEKEQVILNKMTQLRKYLGDINTSFPSISTIDNEGVMQRWFHHVNKSNNCDFYHLIKVVLKGGDLPNDFHDYVIAFYFMRMQSYGVPVTTE